jgi:hypothetical protein
VNQEHVLLDGNRGEILKAALSAYKRAARRHSDLVGVPGSNEGAIFVSLGEALFWAVAIDEMLAARDTGYRSRRDHDPRVQFFPGLKLARNQLTHAVELAAARGPAPFFLKAGGVFHLGTGWIWRDVSRLPQSARHAAPVQRANYEQHLQGRLTYETLALVRQWFGEQVKLARSSDS